MNIMRETSFGKRLLSMLLSLTIIIGLGPVADISGWFTKASAAEGETIYVLAGGDFQAGDNGQEDHYYSRINMGNILDQIKENYSTMDGFIFVGDYDGDSHNDSNAATGVKAMMEEVSERFSTLNHDNSYLIEGNHETGAVSGIDATGGYDCDGYAVYLINETDFCERQEGKSTQIQTVADNLKTWLNNKIGEGYDAPIFVATHTPLGYTTRTYTNGDSLYGKYVFDVLNDAAANGLNIIFMHGHDHAYGADNYLGGEAIYLPVGDKINICVPGDKTAWTEETLNFTYMNAGYVGYYNENYYDVTSYEAEKLTMTVFAITDNQVTVERWSKDGLYNLKSAGREGFYSNASTCAAIGLSYNTTVYASPQTIALVGNDADEMGTIGEWVGVSATVTDDVTTSGNDWTTITEAEAGGIKYVLDTDGVNTNTKYLIVNTGDNGTAYVLTNNNGTVDHTPVTISDGEIIVDNDTNINWTFSGSTSGTVVNQGRYVYPNNGSLALQTSGSDLTFSDQNSGAYKIYRTQSNYYYYLSYNNGWTGARVRTWNGTDSISSVYLFAFKENVTGGNGLYAYLDGELTYPVEVGTSADAALAMVKDGITIKYATAADYSDEAEYGDDAEGMTWTLDPNYDPDVPGDYAVTIAYNGTVLGTAEVIVPATTTYYAAEGNGLYMVDMNTSADDAMAAVKAGVTVYSATDASGSNKTAISDDDVTWNWVDTYNGADSGPYTVEILKDGTSLGTVEVKVNVKYETGINEDWTYVGESEATGGTHTYTLDTDGIDSDGQYIIVAENQALALHTSGSSAATAVSVTISSDGNTLTTDTRDYEYYWNSTYGFTRDGYNGLYQSSWAIYLGTKSESYLDGVVNHNNGKYTLYDNEGNERGLYYNGSSWTVNNGGTTTDYKVRLYKYTGTTGGTDAGPIYAKIEGNTVYTVDQGSSATKALAAVKAGITGYISSNADGSDPTELEDSDLTWTWKNTFNGNYTGSYWVEISYEGKVLGTVEVKVKAAPINNYPEYPDEGAVKVNKTATGIQFQSSGVAQVELSASGVASKKGVDVIIMLDTSSSMTSHTVTGTSKTRAQVLEESLANLITKFKTPGDDGELLDIDIAIADFNGFYGENHSSSGTPYDRDADDMMLETDGNTISYNANSEAQIYTGDKTLGAGAFIDVEDLAASYTLNYTSGTNYDYAMDAIYQMATAKKLANGGEERDLYVIFMSDGAAMQWNYYHSQGASSQWNNWITGAWDADDLTSANLNCTTHKHYYNLTDTNGDGMLNEHWMANAIKGNPTQLYKVIRKTATLGTVVEGEANMYMVAGLGAKMFSISFDAQADTNVTEESMDKSIETLASPQTGTTKYYYKVTSADELTTAFTVIGTEIAYAANNARFVDQMGTNFNLQMTPIVDYAGNAITDNNGNAMLPSIEIISYDIWTRADYMNGKCTIDQIGVRKGTFTVLETITFTSEKNTDGSYTVTGAYSDQIGGGATNILADGTQTGYVKGVIYAKTFIYNTNTVGVAVDGVSIPVGVNTDGTTNATTTNVLPAETFYWKLGTVQTSELAMRYYVYLDGSMEGTKNAGSYATNNFAILYYDNYLGNACKIETTSPSVAWKSANISYAFYLVNEKGEVIVNQTTGQTGTFANKIAVTNPVLFDEVLLNNDGTIKSLNVASLDEGVLPKYYKLYDESSAYYIAIHSDSTGEWRIDSANHKWSAGNDGKYFTNDDSLDTAVTRPDLVNSTYVTHFSNDVQYSNKLEENQVGYDYTHTVVWFAVVWTVEAHPDSVIVDYGLPVDIHVMTNDMFGAEGALAGIGAFDALPAGYETAIDSTLRTGFGTTYTGAYGEAKADLKTGVVRYTPTKMEMNGYERFAYAVNCTDTDKPGYYYDTITVIPATSIYYEDDFLTYTASGTSWTDEGTAIEGATQDEDRPGKYSLTDANNIYGYDSVNLGMSTYSMGTAKKVTVSSGTYATAEFTFYGTGFDIISMTNSTTGTIVVDIYKDGNNDVNSPNFSYVVDTYYGYDYGLYNVTYTYTDGAWVKTVGQKAADGANEQEVNTSAAGVEGESKTGIEYCWVLTSDNDAMYQVPVITKDGLEYGKYKVIVTAFYNTIFDNTDAGKYTLYLDAVRIYDPANNGAEDNDNVIEEAYQIDGEGWPTYFELRNYLIAAGSFGNYDADSNTDGVIDSNDTPVTGLVFIDGKGAVSEISDYVSYGPNNEIYLAPGQRVAFILSLPQNLANVHIGIKSANGEKGAYTITNVAQTEKTVGTNTVKAGTYYAAKTSTIDTNTEMYYDLSGWKNDIIVISNTSNRQDVPTTGIIALTNIKFTYKSNPYASDATGDENSTSAASYRLSAAPTSFSTMATTNELTTVSDGAETTVSNVGSVYMTASAAALAVQAVNAMEAPEEPEAPAVPEGPEVFQPEKLEISLDKGKVKEGEKVKVNVRTSDDVAYITVNGETVTRYKTDRRTGDRIWTVQLRAEEAGDMTIEAIAYNEDGLASEAATAIVKVQAKKKSNEDIIRDILDWLFG